uniref:Uncharacterized protein n=1 Tax=Octactis speculum TaxID=3111310 RepID=A0A7S2AW51_9STRA|mmetsp:Transcript_16338/g.21977  ORF Transcript_16338/g.21977 Transcript_16338/m.21977 type:complete len:186 (+) Transcript_16338:137-694(+)
MTLSVVTKYSSGLKRSRAHAEGSQDERNGKQLSNPLSSTWPSKSRPTTTTCHTRESTDARYQPIDYKKHEGGVEVRRVDSPINPFTNNNFGVELHHRAESCHICMIEADIHSMKKFLAQKKDVAVELRNARRLQEALAVMREVKKIETQIEISKTNLSYLMTTTRHQSLVQFNLLSMGHQRSISG